MAIDLKGFVGRLKRSFDAPRISEFRGTHPSLCPLCLCGESRFQLSLNDARMESTPARSTASWPAGQA